MSTSSPPFSADSGKSDRSLAASPEKTFCKLERALHGYSFRESWFSEAGRWCCYLFGKNRTWRLDAPEDPCDRAWRSLTLCDWPAAEIALRQALRTNPRNAALRNNLGVALKEQRRWEESVFQFRKAAAIQATRPEIYLNLAAVLCLSGDDDAAMAALRRAVHLDRHWKASVRHDVEFQRLHQRFDFMELVGRPCDTPLDHITPQDLLRNAARELASSRT